MNTDKTLTLDSGETLHLRRWLCGRENAPCVLCLHGVESHAGWFDELAAALNAGGADCVAFDRPGWGRSPGVRGHLASYADALRTVSGVATILREQYDHLHLAGLSWGGLLALYAALRRGPLFDSVTLMAPGIAARTDLSAAQKIRVAAALMAGQSEKSVPLAIRVEHFTRRPEKAQFIRDDEYRVKAVSAAFCLETLKMRRFVREAASNRRVPPLTLLLAGDDAIVDNDRTRLLIESLSCRTSEGGSVPAAVHAFSGAAHSLVFEEPQKTAEAILQHQEKLIAAVDTSPQRKRIAVMGAGAIGSLVGGLLALGGHDVSLIGRQAHVGAMNAAGLSLRVGEGTRVVRDNLTAVIDASDIDAPVDLVILAVKGFHTANALESMQPLIQGETAILSLQNGIENEAKICAAYPAATVFAGAICAYTEFDGPGRVTWCDDRGGLAAAVCQGDEAAGLALLSAILPATGMETRFVSRADVNGADAAAGVKWSKLMLNVAFNALNALTGQSAADILSDPKEGTLAASALKEAFAVMRAEGAPPVDLPGYPVRLLSRIARGPVGLLRRMLAWGSGGKSGGASSMRQDLARGRGLTEIDALNGAVVAFGHKHGVPTPANQTLCDRVRQAAEID